MKPVSPVPALPPELERQIFEVCALLRPVGIPKLVLVAWRVKEWVEPLLYRTIAVDVDGAHMIPMLPAFTSECLSSVLESKPASLFRHAVRHLLAPEKGTYTELLPFCTGLENLWTNEYSTVTPLIAQLRLKHLYGFVKPLLCTLTPLHACFSQITHLELMDIRDDWESWSELSLIPQLTHLAFNDADFGPLCGELLETSRSLAVLVFLRSQVQRGLRINASQAAELSKDPRLVEMRCVYYLLDWQMGAHAGKDYWSRAESFIAKRRSGEIDALQYQIPDDESVNLV
ncbi:hypothetical protein C8R44DRAFT_866164 [Mycena epipterygia]|nr:hypothetical protein C8R44DRAFT_866164 [Mycena epipterygia]